MRMNENINPIGELIVLLLCAMLAGCLLWALLMRIAEIF